MTAWRRRCGSALAARRERQPGLSGTALKQIAMVSMLFDHVGAVCLEYGLLHDAFSGREGMLWTIDLGLRMAGRIAFPIYCFLLTEGFLHTHDRRRYLGRLLLFACLSEVPFDLAVQGCLYDPSYQNVLFELSICFLVLWGFDAFRRRLHGGALASAWIGQPQALWLAEGVGMAGIAAAGGAAALLLRTDYDVTGVLFAALYALAAGRRWERTAAAAALGALESLNPCLGSGGLAAFPIWLYNGTRGRTVHRELFYWFYPVHLLVLTGVRELLLRY